MAEYLPRFQRITVNCCGNMYYTGSCFHILEILQTFQSVPINNWIKHVFYFLLENTWNHLTCLLISYWNVNWLSMLTPWLCEWLMNALMATSLNLGIHVVVNWQLAQQVIHCPVSHDHIPSSGLELIVVIISCIQLITEQLLAFWLDRRLKTGLFILGEKAGLVQRQNFGAN